MSEIASLQIRSRKPLTRALIRLIGLDGLLCQLDTTGLGIVRLSRSVDLALLSKVVLRARLALALFSLVSFRLVWFRRFVWVR